MFCKNCGGQLPDGSAFCPLCGAVVTDESGYAPNGAPQGAPQSYPQQDPQFYAQQGAQGYPQQPPQPYPQQPSAAAVQFNSVLQNLKTLLVQLFKEPTVALKNAYSTGDKTAQFCIGGITLAMWFLCGLTALLKARLGGGSAFGYAVLITLAAAAAMAGSGGWYYLFSDKTRSFADISALVGASSLHGAVCLAVLLLCLLIGGLSNYMLVLFLLLLLLIVDTVATCCVAQIVCGEQKAYYLALGLSAILMALLLLIGGSVVANAIESYLSSLLWSWF